MTINSRRNIIELREIRDDVQDMDALKVRVNEAIVELNYILRNLTMVNLDGEIKTVTLPAGATTRISHRLQLIPKYRIILGQVGGGVITDGEFTSNYIELTNSGGSDAVVSLIIVKG